MGRSNLGRMLAAGSGWSDVTVDEARAPGRRYSTSLGRALAGGPAWQQLPLGDERSQGSLLDKTASVRNDHQAKHRRTSTSLAAGEAGEAGVQELLWEAGKAGAEGGDVGVLSPETAAVKRASALESGRFLDSIAEAEAEARRSRLFEEGDGGDSSPGDDESDAAAPAATDVCIQTESGDTNNPSPPVPASTNATSSNSRAIQRDGGRLHLSMATAVLSVAQRMSDMEERASVRVRGAEGLARQALEEARREGKEGRERQSAVMLRLKRMEHGSEQRVRAVTGQIAKLREEGRLKREPEPPQKETMGTFSSSSSGKEDFLDDLAAERPPVSAPVEQRQEKPAWR
ncbi:unnamed protein product [Laminaria digitata]